MKNRSTFPPEREFGLVVGAILLLIAAWWIYRGRSGNIILYLLILGSLLITLAALLPRALVYPNRIWIGLGGILSRITTPIFLAVIYFLVMTPIGLFKRAFGWDPLDRRAKVRNSYWMPYQKHQQNSRHYEKMF